jgi:hypothetical protein
MSISDLMKGYEDDAHVHWRRDRHGLPSQQGPMSATPTLSTERLPLGFASQKFLRRTKS